MNTTVNQVQVRQPVQAQQAPLPKIPPKLQQLLEVMQDVDKVTLLHIARQYQMDLDDPGFLPLLLTKEGIQALQMAVNSLTSETEKAVNFVLQKSSSIMNDVSQAELAKLQSFSQQAADYIQSQQAASEAAMKTALSQYSGKVVTDTSAQITAAVAERLAPVEQASARLANSVEQTRESINLMRQDRFFTKVIICIFVSFLSAAGGTLGTMKMIGPSNDDKVAQAAGYKLFQVWNQNQIDERTKKALTNAGVLQ